jgi:acetolactate synthase-1/2/3 large subunit
MGYGLPAALGVAVKQRGKRVICIEGDGSIQMNIQELQTVIHNRLNIKIFWLNNDGYHSIRQTQTNFFDPPLCGVNSDNGVSFPDVQRIAYAYNIPFRKIESTANIKQQIVDALNIEGPVIIEAVIDPQQFFEPKLSARQLPDGSMVSPSLEDMFPFLPDEEMKNIILEVENI